MDDFTSQNIMFLLVKYIVIIITMYVTGVTIYVSELTEYVMRAPKTDFSA